MTIIPVVGVVNHKLQYTPSGAQVNEHHPAFVAVKVVYHLRIERGVRDLYVNEVPADILVNVIIGRNHAPGLAAALAVAYPEKDFLLIGLDQVTVVTLVVDRIGYFFDLKDFLRH
ncbi:MAG: hypothetical protein ACKO0Z_07475 [Betaproteobacteria bacterium]